MASSNRIVRPVAWLGLVVAALSLLAVAAFDQGGVETDTERIQRLNESFACPECDGESVAESNAAVSATIRQRIAEQVTAGATDEEIRDELLGAYGAAVLLNPPADGFAALIWILPVVVAVFGAMGAGLALSRRASVDRAPTEEDRELLRLARQKLASDGSSAGTAAGATARDDA